MALESDGGAAVIEEKAPAGDNPGASDAGADAAAAAAAAAAEAAAAAAANPDAGGDKAAADAAAAAAAVSKPDGDDKAAVDAPAETPEAKAAAEAAAAEAAKATATEAEWKAWVDAAINDLPETERAAAREKLSTRASRGDWARGILNADAKISELTEAQKTMVKIPGKDAKPEEVEAFHKAIGVPEKAEDYVFPVSEDPVDVALFPEVAKVAKSEGLTQKQCDAVIAGIQQFNQAVEVQILAGAEQQHAECEDTLRTKYTVPVFNEKKATVNEYVNKVIGSYMGVESAQTMLKTIQSNGKTYGNDTGFFEWLDSIAQMSKDAGQLLGLGGGGGTDPAARHKELMGLMTTNLKEYQSPKVQTELAQLIQRMNTAKLHGK